MRSGWILLVIGFRMRWCCYTTFESGCSIRLELTIAIIITIRNTKEDVYRGFSSVPHRKAHSFTPAQQGYRTFLL